MGSAFLGVIIEESLEKKDVLKNVRIITTLIEAVTPRHKTPYLTQWTLHKVEILEKDAVAIAQEISTSIDSKHPDWYADFKNDRFHFIIFRNKVFRVDRSKPDEYKPVVEYGLRLGIPKYQLDFTPEIKEWKR